MSDALKKLNEFMKEAVQDPKFQIECTKCKKKVFYQFVGPGNRCLSCPTLMEDMFKSIPINNTYREQYAGPLLKEYWSKGKKLK